MTESKRDPLSSVLEEHAAVVIPDGTSSGGLNLTEVLAWRSWFNLHRRKLESSGGRPTNPAWNLKRQVPFSREVWGYLESRAAVCSEDGPSVGPGQVASFLIEDAVREEADATDSPQEAGIDTDDPLEEISDDARFREWTMPSLFSGCSS